MLLTTGKRKQMNLHPIHAQYFEQRKREQLPGWAQKLLSRGHRVSIDDVINAHARTTSHDVAANRSASIDMLNFLALLRQKRRTFERQNAQRTNPDPLRPMVELQADLCKMAQQVGPGYSAKRRALCVKYARIICLRICELQREREREKQKQFTY